MSAQPAPQALASYRAALEQQLLGLQQQLHFAAVQCAPAPFHTRRTVRRENRHAAPMRNSSSSSRAAAEPKVAMGTFLDRSEVRKSAGRTGSPSPISC